MKTNDLRKYFEELEIEFDERKIAELDALMHSTLSQNEKFNLTAITDEDVFVEKMILDSAIALKDLELDGKKVIDIGTGAGYPGMVIRILSKADVYLLDSTKKKIDYLVDYAKENNMNVHGLSMRAEDYARAHGESMDYAFARAVASLNILLELIMPMLKVGGYFIALKGAGYEEEINNSANAFKKLGCHIESIYETELPESKEKRAIIRIKKDKPTNKKYPRQYSDIKSKPL